MRRSLVVSVLLVAVVAECDFTNCVRVQSDVTTCPSPDDVPDLFDCLDDAIRRENGASSDFLAANWICSVTNGTGLQYVTFGLNQRKRTESNFYESMTLAANNSAFADCGVPSGTFMEDPTTIEESDPFDVAKLVGGLTGGLIPLIVVLCIMGVTCCVTCTADHLRKPKAKNYPSGRPRYADE